MKIKYKDEATGPILLALMNDTRAEINLETYVFKFAPCARARVGRAFRAAVAQQIIEPVAVSLSGSHIYKRTEACAELMS